MTIASRLMAADTITMSDPRDPAVRLGQLLDPDSITAMQEPDGSGVAWVRGRVNGRTITAYCTDATIMGGAMGMQGCQHIVAAIDAAVRLRCPVIGVWHSGGARLGDGVESMDAVGQVFAAMTRASGRIPQVSVVLGPAAGAAAYGPALTDLVIMSAAGRMFVTGPDVVRAVTGENISMEDLGGATTHSRRSGVAHVVVDTEAEAFQQARHVIDLFARPGRFEPPVHAEGADLLRLLPERTRVAYDVHILLRELLDPDESGGFVELQRRWAPNIVVGLGRLAGRTIGVVANNPIRKGGCLDSLSAEKAARFVRMCDALGVPILTIVDVPGYLPGVGQEWGGVIRRGAKLLHAFAEATVPRITLITRKAYGGAYIAMNSRSLGAAAVFAWPDAEIAVMSADAAVGILYRRQLAAAAPEERDSLRQELVETQRVSAGGVARAIALGVVDEVVHPTRTRSRLVEAFATALPGRGHHGNVPL